MAQKKHRWRVVAPLLACAGCIALTSREAVPQPPIQMATLTRAPAGSFALALDKPPEMDVQSPGVQWGGNVYHLVRLGRAEFHLSPLSRLTADISGAVTTFDDVDYDVHVAVFNAQGQLLGTGRTICSVSRIWVGTTGVTSKTLQVDLGVNRDYAQAKYFSVSISNTKVLTPDQWQKEK